MGTGSTSGSGFHGLKLLHIEFSEDLNSLLSNWSDEEALIGRRLWEISHRWPLPSLDRPAVLPQRILLTEKWSRMIATFQRCGENWLSLHILIPLPTDLCTAIWCLSNTYKCLTLNRLYSESFLDGWSSCGQGVDSDCWSLHSEDAVCKYILAVVVLTQWGWSFRVGTPSATD